MAYNLALKLTGNPSDAEDLSQDALLRAVKALPRFRGDSSLSTWLYRIVLNTWKNRVRSESRRGLWKFISLDWLPQEDEKREEFFKSNEPPVDHSLLQAERFGEISAALAKLDDESRAVIVLRDIEEKSYEEISEILDIPLGTVKSRLARARDGLKEMYKEKSNEPR